MTWPGQFVFGYRRQSLTDPREPPKPPADIAVGGPPWARNGSFLVIRRLRQDVPAFRRFVRAAATMLAAQPGFRGMSATRFASMCVGRWPSGAPLMRSPTTDVPALGNDPFANNFFQYAADSPAPPPVEPGQAYPGDQFPTSRADDRGTTCPLSSHVRKVNPRDTITEQGSATDTLARLVLRRGIPYGSPCPGDLETDLAYLDDRTDRGLVFVSYQTSIENQFVFLQRTWANHAQNPNGGGGEDPIIGQGDRSTGGVRALLVRAPGQAATTIPITTDWVIPTGGGFFFSSGISTLAGVLGRHR